MKFEIPARTEITLHLVMMFVWAALIVPTILFWYDSILWVAFMSLYANIASHWSAHEAAKAELKAERRTKK